MYDNNVIVSIIIPTLNEEKNIGIVLQKIPENIKKISEIIIVDSSTDKTPIIAKKYGAKVIKVPKKGKGYAMKIGAKIAKGHILVFMDGDGSDPPEIIPTALRKLENNDIVICSRNPYLKGNFIYRFFALIYMPVLKKLFRAIGFKIKGDPLAGFRIIKRKIWDRLNMKSDDFFIETEMNIKIAKLKLKIAEVPIPILPRMDGILNSKFIRSINQELKIISTLINLYFDSKIKICSRSHRRQTQ